MSEALTIIAIVVGIFTSLLTLAYWIGKLSSRVDALESWRNNIRLDMHEISEIQKQSAVNQATMLERIDNANKVITEIKNIIDRRDWSTRPK